MFKISPVLAIGSALSILSASIAFAQVPSVDGDWKMSIAGEKSLAPTYTLIQKGTALTGTFRAPMGDLPLTGTITKDNKVTFSAQAGGMNLKFVGTVNGKTMKGVADLPMKGRKNWTATK
jgi:hypothetical protein